MKRIFILKPALKQLQEILLNALSTISLFYGLICFKVIMKGFAIFSFSDTCWALSPEKSWFVLFTLLHCFLPLH